MKLKGYGWHFVKSNANNETQKLTLPGTHSPVRRKQESTALEALPVHLGADQRAMEYINGIQNMKKSVETRLKEINQNFAESVEGFLTD